MDSFRIRINAAKIPLIERERFWIFIDKSKFKIINHVETKIQSLLGITANIKIKIDGYCLLSDDCIEIIKPDDILELELVETDHHEIHKHKKKKKDKERNSDIAESINENGYVKKSKKRKLDKSCLEAKPKKITKYSLDTVHEKFEINKDLESHVDSIQVKKTIPDIEKELENSPCNFKVHSPKKKKRKRRRKRKNKSAENCSKNFEDSSNSEEKKLSEASGINNSTQDLKNGFGEIKKKDVNQNSYQHLISKCNGIQSIDTDYNKHRSAEEKNKSEQNNDEECDLNDCKEQFLENIAKYPVLEGLPRLGDHVAFKVLELKSDYTPELSDYKSGKVMRSSNGNVMVKLDKPEIKTNHGKFDLEYDDIEETEQITELEICWSNVSDPRLLSS
ncbi:Coilin [Nymphon striatum]|nr:Coilin [Nymphon striatum]